jgi:hypothetical protein
MDWMVDWWWMVDVDGTDVCGAFPPKRSRPRYFPVKTIPPRYYFPANSSGKKFFPPRVRFVLAHCVRAAENSLCLQQITYHRKSYNGKRSIHLKMEHYPQCHASLKPAYNLPKQA